MENSEDACDILANGEEHDGNDNIPSTSASSSHKLFGSHNSVHRMMGGGRGVFYEQMQLKAADVMLWHRRHVSFGVIIVATVGWFLFERSGLPFLPICSDVLLLLILYRFIHANYAAIRKRPLKSLPEPVLSEDMVNSAAASFRVKINYMLLMTHDISRGKDFKLFFKVVFALWLLSVAGSFISFFTLAYIGVIVFITIPAMYNRYQSRVDTCCGMIQRNLSKHYKTVDDNVISRLPRNLSRHKDL